MCAQTSRLALPYLQPAQAQKHVTFNEAMAMLDAMVQLSVLQIDATVPPDVMQNGDTYALGPAASGAWTGQDSSLAIWRDTGWVFVTPRRGWRVWDQQTDRGFVFGPDGWTPEQAASNNLSGLGIGAAWDTTNRLSVAAPATLLSHAGDSHRVKINKATAPDTASVLFQSNFDGRAEIGLTGNNALSVKTRPAGGDWSEALLLDPAAQTATLSSGGGSRWRLTQAQAEIFPAGASGWSEIYGQHNTLGPVSQAAGAVTGALFESGTNTDGEYRKFADGTLICTRSVTHDATTEDPTDYPMPEAFLSGSAPAASFTLNGPADLSSVRDAVQMAISATPTAWRLRMAYAGNTPSNAYTLLAIGRWY